jgi:hypothetical protein
MIGETSDVTSADTGTVDTLQKTIKSKQDFHRYWMSAIELATKTEKEWREDAKTAISQFRSDRDGYRAAKFNILYANIQTVCPAIYNSMPTADVRARFGEAMPVEPPPVPQNDPQAQQMAVQATSAAQAQSEQVNKDRGNVSQVIERAISVQADLYDYDDALKAAVKDRELLGRAVTRLRVNQVMGPDTTDQESGNAIPGAVVSQHITWEPVIWDDFRVGPAKRWADTPWIAFHWVFTRDELEGLNEELAWKVNLDATVEGQPDKDASTPDTFKRANVWEIWDRSKRKVYWLAESYDQGPLKVEDDPYRLLGFFPVPRPRLAIETTDTQVPICPFMVWQAQQDEMNSLTRRIGALIKVIKWRGIYDGAFENAVKAMKGLDEGEMAPAPDAARALVQGDIEKAFWLMPIEQAVSVLKQLYESREMCKQVIYELTGVADILRGSTKASETLGAQELKAQWGSLRLQSAQQDIQLHARDLMRMTADLMAEHFRPEELEMMTGISLTPEQLKLFKTDMRREFNIDIETDGTIKADLGKQQENVGGFVQGLATYFAAIGPAVEAGYMTPPEAVGLARTFARNFKLGRQADHILDEWQKRLDAKAKEPPAPPQPDPRMQVEQIKAQTAQQQAQAEIAKTQMQGQIDQQTMTQEAQLKQAEFDMRMQEMQAEQQRARETHAMEMQKLQADATIAAGKHALAVDQQARAHEMGRESHAQGLEALEAKRKKGPPK